MSTRRLFQSRPFLILFALIPLSLVVLHYYKNSSLSEKISSLRSKDNVVVKILEINDRDPTYKLAAYEGYEFPLDRNRAQTKLLTYLKLYDTCKKNPNTTVLDVGSSLGEFGLYAGACGCQVYMFEIEPRKTSLIERSIKLNRFESNVHLIKKAVSDLKPDVKVYFSKNTSSQISSTRNDTDSKDTYFGETISLNHYPFLSPIYLLRIDVQGHELHVFRSAEKLFRQQLINHAIFEYTSYGIHKVVQKDVFQYLKKILGAKQVYALHPKQPLIYGPLTSEDMEEFHSQHAKQRLQRDVYVLFKDDMIPIDANPYNFYSSF